MRFSANLGFLFRNRPLPQAIRDAKAAGFDAVECHFPYDTPPRALRAALDETGLPLLSLNTAPGARFGLAALPGQAANARAAIDQAIAYAAEVGAGMVHVMAGQSGGSTTAEDIYRANLAYACDRAAPHGLTILIEPINTRDVPGYHLSRVERAAETIAAIGADNLKIMFDCYHVQIMQGDLTRRVQAHRALIGHLQIAAVPDRGPPCGGEVSYRRLLPALAHPGPIGAEYHDTGCYDWLEEFRKL